METERAKQRQGARSDIQEQIPECDRGQARDKVGDKLGVSGKTAERVADGKPWACITEQVQLRKLKGKGWACTTEMVVHGDMLEATQTPDGKVWVSLRRCCENLGLDLKSQLEKLRAKPWAIVGENPMMDAVGRVAKEIGAGGEAQSIRTSCGHLPRN